MIECKYEITSPQAIINPNAIVKGNFLLKNMEKRAKILKIIAHLPIVKNSGFRDKNKSIDFVLDFSKVFEKFSAVCLPLISNILASRSPCEL